MTEAGHQLVSECLSVGCSPMDVGRCPGAQHREPERIDTWGIGHDAAVVAEAAPPVENGEIEPRVVGSKTGASSQP